MKIVFYGRDTEAFADGFPGLLSEPAEIAVLPNVLAGATDRNVFAAADVIVANRFSASVPSPRGLKLLNVPAAGFDAIDMTAVPAGAAVCNSFGHEQAIAEFVLAALLARAVPLADADARLRRGDWAYWAGAPERAHAELSEMTLGLFGFGHIGRTIAGRAKAFDMTVVVANRSPCLPRRLWMVPSPLAMQPSGPRRMRSWCRYLLPRARRALSGRPNSPPCGRMP